MLNQQTIEKLYAMRMRGRLLPYLFEARKRGVLFDVGHGGAAFEFRQAVPAVRQGFPPDSISTDVHSGSINAGVKDQLNVMSKFLNMGMSLDDVTYRSTWNPARMMHREQIGHLTVGALADVAVLRVEKGQFAFVDSWGARMDGTQRLVCELTLASGRVVYDLNGLTARPLGHSRELPAAGRRLLGWQQRRRPAAINFSLEVGASSVTR